MTEPARSSLTLGMKPIARTLASEEVAQRLQELIAARSMKRGERLPTERELSETLGVGRGAVREGVRYLAALDIVSIRQGAGTFVKEPQRLALLKSTSFGSEERRTRLRLATEARCAIDCSVVEAATRAGDAKVVPALLEHLEFADAEPSRTRLAHAIDLTFEQIIGDFCGNVFLAALQREAHGYFRATWEGAGLMPRPADERSQQHWHIFDAIRSGDATEARRRMEEHFRLQALAPSGN